MEEAKRAGVRRTVEEWGTFRDSGAWESLAALFHPDGVIRVAWYSGHHRTFLDLSKASAGKSFSKHVICNSAIQVRASRAVAETNVILLGRGEFGGGACHGETHMRFLDRLEVDDSEHWRIVERSSVYDHDLLAPMWPGDTIAIDRAAASTWPVEYRFLALRLSARGLAVQPALPTKGSEAELQIRRCYTAWLAGDRV